MGRNYQIEVCLISARGLRRSSSLWKLQWFAVGWIDPKDKYCTKIDAPANANPIWRTRFSAPVDASSESKLEELALCVEVYSREPIFLRERLHGTATVALKEFIRKRSKGSSVGEEEEIGSFQLRKGKSGDPRGFVDVSIRVSEERDEPSSSYAGFGEGFVLSGSGSGINLTAEQGPPQAYRPPFPIQLRHRENHTGMSPPYAHPTANLSNVSAGKLNSSSLGGTSYYKQSQTAPPPLPPNTGYLPTLLPRTDHLSATAVNISSSRTAPARNGGSSLGMGLGAGALAAGAMIFGDDFMSGFDGSTGFNDFKPAISSHPPF